jgi:hypothetical protein
MSVVVRFHPTNATKEKYDESLRRMEAAGIWPNPPGLEVHVAFGSADDLRVSEIWTSREQFQAYGEKLMPILDENGDRVLGRAGDFRGFRTSSSSRRLGEG